MFHRLILASLLVAAVITPAVAQPPKLPMLDPEKMADPAEAARVADALEKEYAGKPQPEAVRMLISILRGKLGGDDGWFGPAQTRYTFEWLAKRNGIDPAAGGLARGQFRGSPALFDRLDRDGDGRIAPTDLDWSDRNPYMQQMAFTNRTFRKLDADGDGKVTREDLDAFFKRVAQGKESITPEDLRRELFPSGPAGLGPGDAPSIPMLVRSLYGSELGSLHEGPKIGDAAPDFTLKSPDGKTEVTLGKVIGKKPVVLILGNFTCGPFRALVPELEAIHRRYKGQAKFVMVYVREAHPIDGWKMEANARVGVAVKQPKTTEERAAVCALFKERLKPEIPVVVDTIDDDVGNAYSGMPGRLYVIDPAGKVAYKSGRGPFGFKAGEMEQALALALLEAEAGK